MPASSLLKMCVCGALAAGGGGGAYVVGKRDGARLEAARKARQAARAPRAAPRPAAPVALDCPPVPVPAAPGPVQAALPAIGLPAMGLLMTGQPGGQLLAMAVPALPPAGAGPDWPGFAPGPGFGPNPGPGIAPAPGPGLDLGPGPADPAGVPAPPVLALLGLALGALLARARPGARR